MPNKAAAIRAQIEAENPGAVLAARQKKSVIYDLPGGNQRRGIFALDALHAGTGPVFTETDEVNTDWVAADPVLDAPWEWKIAKGDGFVGFFSSGNDTFDSGQLLQFRHEATGEFITVNLMGSLFWTNDIDQIEQVAAPGNVSPTISGQTVEWLNAYGTGRNFRWTLGPEHLQKFLDIPNGANLPAPPQFIIDGGNPKLVIQIQFLRSAGVELWIDGTEWADSNQDDRVTADVVEFRDATGTVVLWRMKIPEAWDSKPDADDVTTFDRIKGELHIYRQGQTRFIEIRFPWSWIETAVFPVTFDATFNISASADDAHEAHNNASYSDSDTIVAFHARSQSSGRYSGGYRFDMGASGPAQGDTIDTATCTHTFPSSVRDSPACDIHCHDVDASAAFTSSTSPWDRDGALTTASTLWDADDVGSPATSPDFAAAADEVVQRPGWDANFLTVINRGLSNQTSRAESGSQDGGNASTLDLTWTAAGDDFPPLPGYVQNQDLNPVYRM